MRKKRTVWALLTGGAVLIAAIGLRYRLVVVSGPSMQPALQDRQLALMDCSAARDQPLRKGDIVVFRHGAEIYVKRVFALAGDTVRTIRFSNGATCLADNALFPLDKVRRLSRSRPGSVEFRSQIVPSGSIFVLGDNRVCSVDSRSFGSIPAGSIVGRIVTSRQLVAALPARLAGAAARLGSAIMSQNL